MVKTTVAEDSRDDEAVVYNPDCTLCKKLCEHANNICIPGDGPDNAEIMLVGEAPGKQEDRQELPFVGEIGQFLWDRILPAAGLDGNDLYMSNSARCWPPNKNRRPTARELQNCRQYLEAEIAEVQPRVIVALGNAPMASLLGMIYKSTIDDQGNKTKEGKVSGITKWRGKKIWSREFNCWIVPTFHPSYVYRAFAEDGSRYSFNLITDDIAMAASLVDVEPKGVISPKTVWIKKETTARRVLQTMWNAGTFAYDTETGGKGRAIDKRIIGVSFSCSPERGFYIEWGLIKKVYGDYVKLVSSKKHIKYMHNGSYDIKIHRFTKVPIYDKYVDTMIGAHMLDENFGKSLKDLAWAHTNFGGYDIPLDRYKSEHKIKEDYSEIPTKILAPYGALDAVATYILGKKFEVGLKKENLYPLYNKIVMPVRRVMSNAEYNGLCVNIDYARELQATCGHAMELLDQAVYKYAGREFNINSPPQLSNVLFEDMGLEWLKRTKTGYSVDKESVEFIKGQEDGEIAIVLSDRNYLKAMLKDHIKKAVVGYWPEDGKVHTNYHLARAVTGRASCSKPGLHNVPRDRLLRIMYIASPGHLLVEADLRSAELAYLAAESGEEAFINAFALGLDLHTETARLIFNVDEPTEMQRFAAKSINFGLVYGMTAFGLSARLKISIEKADEFIEMYFDRFPKIAAYMERLRQHASEYGWVQSLFRRRRRLPGALSDIEYEYHRAMRQAQNSPIQGGAADYTYLGLVRLDRGLRKDKMRAKIVHTVHDCGITDTPRPEVERVKEIVVKAFETPVKVIPVRMQVELEVSKAWGEHTKDSRVLEILESVGLSKRLEKLIA